MSNTLLLTILYFSSTGWTQTVKQAHEFLTDPDPPKLQYVLMAEDVFTAGKQMAPELSRYFQMPTYTLSAVYRRSNGFFGFDESLDNNSHRQSYKTWFRHLVKVAAEGSDSSYVWHEMTFISHWTPGRCAVLCIGIPASFYRLLHSALLSIWPKLPPSEPYSLHVAVVEAIVSLQDSSVWSVRDVVRSIEQDRSRSARTFRDFLSLHDAARHAIHSYETLGASIETLEAMERNVLDCLNRTGKGEPVNDSSQIQMHIGSQVRMLRNLERRSQSNKERLQNEISLAYNMIAQRDSQTMTRLGQAAKVDSGAMRTIAVVTMAFLPPTFLSAIFSMSFFSYSPGQGTEPSRWSVSSKFWIYWAFAIPLSCLTIATWVWREKRKTREKLA